MTRPVTKRDLLWGYSASVLNIGAGLILLPVILRFLPPEDVGLWFVFITLASLAQLLEMGFQPTIARNAAYVYAGAQSLQKVGLKDETSNQQPINLELLDALVFSARRIYQFVAFLSLLILLVGGSFYIAQLVTPTQNHDTAILAWLAFAGGYVVNFYYGYINGLLQGRGDIAQANKVIVITKSTLILLGAAAVATGYGMLGLGLAAMVSSIFGRIAAYRYFHSGYYPIKTSVELSKRAKLTRELVKILWHNASRLGLVQLGAFLIQRGNILIASSFLGLEAAASYGMSVTVLMSLSGIAMVISQLQFAYMSALQTKGHREALSVVYGRILFMSWALFLLGLFFLLAYGAPLLVLLGSKTELLPEWMLLLLGVIMLLEMNHSIAATYLTTTNHIPFVYAAIFSGIGIFLLSLITIVPMGVFGLIATQGLVQLAYNNWKWPSNASKHLQSRTIELMLIGMRSFFKKNSQ